LALATQEPLDGFQALRAPVLSRPTPFIAGDAAIFDAQGSLLLIQRADNHKWAMPGGSLEVGETPAAGVEREAYEETGVRCQAVQLIGIFDSRLSGSITRHHLYLLVFLCRPLSITEFGHGSHQNEISGLDWFSLENLPADLAPGHASRIPQAFKAWRGENRAFFDSSQKADDTTQ
jgi:8-oxo-dGTP pyrophosphatase MutT (NUDIX family)